MNDELIAFLFAGWLAYTYGSYVGRVYLRYAPSEAVIYGGLLTFMAGLFIGFLIVVPVFRLVFRNPLRAFAGKSRLRGWMRSNPRARRLYGRCMNGLVLLMVGAPFYGVPLLAFLGWQVHTSALWPSPAWLTMGAVIVAAVTVQRGRAHSLKVWLGVHTRKLRYDIRSYGFGRGGTAAYASIFEDWGEAWQPGAIRQGGSTYDPKFTVGGMDDRHFITIATTRSGKGRSCIIPNLLTWPGSALVVDVKGQNAIVTAQARRDMGQDVHIVDPFGVLKSWKINDKVSRWNPLAEIDPKAPLAYEDIEYVSDALVVSETTSNSPFWDRTSRSLFTGLIAHVLTWPHIPKEARNLGQVFHLLNREEGLPFREMVANNHPNLARTINSIGVGISQFSDDTMRDVVGTVREHLKWMSSGALKNALAESDFTLRDLKRKPMTIYLVIPPNLLLTHNRFLRLFINMALSAFAKDPAKGEQDCLLLLDEFYSLGRLQKLTEVMANLAGYGVRVWPIIQNIGQLVDLYSKNWETFLGQAGQWQVFAMNDGETMDYLSKRMGRHVVYEKQRGVNGTWEYTPVGSQLFREPQELAMDSNRRNGQMLVFTEGGDPHFLLRQNYDKLFKKSQYRADPAEVRGVRAEDQEVVPEEPEVIIPPDPERLMRTVKEQQAMDEIQWAGDQARARRKAGQPGKRMTAAEARQSAAKLLEDKGPSR